MGERITRGCIRCGREITACNGFTLGRDLLSYRYPIRELCGSCVEQLELSQQKDQYLMSLE